jgi:hypothetical protein
MRTFAPAVACVLALAGVMVAQETPGSTPQEKPSVSANAPKEARTSLVPLKVQIVLSRFKAEKKIASLPYTLTVTANDRGPTNLRMGIEVPIAMRGGGGVNYRNVGTNIDCFAASTPGDSYKLNITVEDSSVHLDAKAVEAGSTPVVQDTPAFRTFKSSFALLLRDGQSGQYTSAVDPISGEVIKVDVTLNVLK